MLLQLNIQNIALIDEVSIVLENGLNILTGETGAGKSIIIDSINAVLGDRVSKEVIRTGSEKALVEAVFNVDAGHVEEILKEMGMEMEEDGTLILSRELTQSGRNTCRVNGKMVAASYLKALGERLVDLHGQHDNQSLLKADNHIELLDSFGGEAIKSIKQEYLSLLDKYKQTKNELKALSGDPGERERKIDLLRFQIDEIKNANLKDDEEEKLNKQKTMLANSQKISASLSEVYNLLHSGETDGRAALDLLNAALASLNTIGNFDESYDELQRQLQDFIYQIEDLADDVRKHFESVEYNPALLEETEERLDLIFRLKRKYGASIPEIHQYCMSAEKQLEELEKSEELTYALSNRLAEIEKQLYESSCRLNAERKKAASVLEERVALQLNDLEMKKSKFKVDIQFDEDARKYTVNGLDKVEFMISANVGEPLKPLAKIASGGEMSRIMLAIKTILAEVDKIPTMIFDEIDIGISGKAAKKVGEKLAYISLGHQVICVTHLAQIACMADHHYQIEKITEENTTRTIVNKLDAGERIKEISRLIGGSESSETSLKYAEEMINDAKELKKA